MTHPTCDWCDRPATNGIDGVAEKGGHITMFTVAACDAHVDLLATAVERIVSAA